MDAPSRSLRRRDPRRNRNRTVRDGALYDGGRARGVGCAPCRGRGAKAGARARARQAQVAPGLGLGRTKALLHHRLTRGGRRRRRLCRDLRGPRSGGMAGGEGGGGGRGGSGVAVLRGANCHKRLALRHPHSLTPSLCCALQTFGPSAHDHSVLPTRLGQGD
jgi:hypothetical protein